MTDDIAITVTIETVLAGAPDLAARTPCTATALNQLPADRGDLQFWCARLDEPLRYRYPAHFDTTRCQPDYLDSDEQGPFLWILVVVLGLSLSGPTLTAAGRRTTADLAYVIDNSLGYDVYLDHAKIEFVGTVGINSSPPSAGLHDRAPAAAAIPDNNDAAEIKSLHGGRPEGTAGEHDKPPPLARNADEFYTQLHRLITELTKLGGRHPGHGRLQPREFTAGADTIAQTGFSINDDPLTYRCWGPGTDWDTRFTNDFDELLYWIIDDLARSLAWRITVNAPSYAKLKTVRAQHRLFFPYWQAMVMALDLRWGEQTASTIDGHIANPRGFFDALDAAAAVPK